MSPSSVPRSEAWSESVLPASRSAVVVGLGTAWPASSVEQSVLAEAAVQCGCRDEREARVLRGLYRRSGVRRRGCAILDAAGDEPERTIADCFPPSCDAEDRGPSLAARMAMYERSALPLAERAAWAALRDGDVAALAVRHLVTVSCTGFAAPGVDLGLIERLRLPADVSRTHVGFMGCHAAMNGLAAAEALAVRHGGAALLVCVEVCTAHFRYGHDPRSLVANALFADGAAAAVLAPRPRNEVLQGADGSPRSVAGLRLVSRRSVVVPNTGDAMTWRLGDHGFEMTLDARVPDLIGDHLGDAVLPWLQTHGLTPSDLAGVAVHPGGPRVIGSALSALGLPDSAGGASRSVLAEHGNMSSPTVLMILDRLRRERDAAGAAKGEAWWLALAFGPGLAVEAMLLRE